MIIQHFHKVWWASAAVVMAGVIGRTQPIIALGIGLAASLSLSGSI
jgi:hypothetical protein